MKMGLKHGTHCVVFLVLVTFTLNLVVSETVALSDISLQPGRRFLQTKDTSNNIIRTDPLDHFRKYRGQYNITNKHYWSSTMFTGIYGFVMGLFLILAGVVYSIYLLALSCCFRNKKRIKLKKRVPCQKKCYLVPVVLSTFFVVLAIIVSGITLAGNIQFHSRAKTIMTEVINTANQASNTMYNATEALRKISVNLIQSGTFEDDQAAKFLASTSDKLDYEATGLATQAEYNRNLGGRVLSIMYVVTSVIICLSLAASVALTVFGVLRFRRVVYMLVIFAWFLCVLCWLFFGAYFFVERFSGDTCLALRNFQKNPETNSLSSILPCGEFSSARIVLADVSVGLYQVLTQVNMNISIIRANSLPSLSYVCNPFSGPPYFLYQPKSCPADSIRIGDIPQMLKMLTCSDNTETKCSEGFISTSEYTMIASYTSSVQNLLDAYPGMENLVNCQLVKDTFSDILVNHCKPVMRYIKTTCVGVLLLSIVLMVLISIWVSTNFHDNRHFADGSVQPNTVP